MNTEELAQFALQRVAAYEGLPIDATTWNDAHTYHQRAQQLHTRALHGWGIVAGLQVMPTDPPSRTVIVQPGLAIDHEGHAIRVPQPQRLDVQRSRPGPALIVLRFVDQPVQPAGATGPASRVDEGFHLLVADPPLSSIDIEVARVDVADVNAPLHGAGTAWAPAPGEIDSRFRRHLRPPLVDTLTIGRLVTAEGSTGTLHRQGLANVIQELRCTAPFVVQFVGDVHPEGATGVCDLLYLCSAGELRLAPREAAHLLGFLRAGGVLFAEPCAEVETARQENGRFVAAFQRLMADLKYPLEEVKPGHRLLQARHVFGQIPEGVGGRASILCRNTIILNPNDYGCCWQGGMTGKPLPREPIRSAMEFAANVAWYAAEAIGPGGVQRVDGARAPGTPATARG